MKSLLALLLIIVVYIVLIASTVTWIKSLHVTRISKPPIKIKDPNDIRRRDICEVHYDRGTGTIKTGQDYVHSET